MQCVKDIALKNNQHIAVLHKDTNHTPYGNFVSNSSIKGSNNLAFTK